MMRRAGLFPGAACYIVLRTISDVSQTTLVYINRAKAAPLQVRVNVPNLSSVICHSRSAGGGGRSAHDELWGKHFPLDALATAKPLQH
jgi:hypothetical protein